MDKKKRQTNKGDVIDAPTRQKPHLAWPDCCNAGVIFRVLLIVNTCVLIPPLLSARDLSSWIEHWLQATMLTEPATLTTLMILCGLRKRLSSQLIHLTLPQQWAVAALIAFITTWCLDTILLGHIRTLLGTSHSIKTSLLAAVVASGFTLLFLHYFDLRSKAYSPALNEARLTALSAKIRPHFFFNSLNTVLALIRTEPKRAESTLEDLAELLRTLMRDARELVPLQDEIQLCQRYLNIEHTRLGERLTQHWHIEEGLEHVTIPSLMLQPLIENAVHHGIESLPGGGWVDITIKQVSEQLMITVKNARIPGLKTQRGNGLAMANIRERLSLQYDLTAQLSIDDRPEVFTVTLNLPIQP